MIKISFPKDQLKIRKRGSLNETFDEIRKKWILLTPEEWVRQNILQYLLIIKNYPPSLISIEKEIKLGELRKRCDIVVYNRETIPWMIIECKEMHVGLTEKVVSQVLRYHIALPATYLVITNGSFTRGFVKQDQKFSEIDSFPDFL